MSKKSKNDSSRAAAEKRDRETVFNFIVKVLGLEEEREQWISEFAERAFSIATKSKQDKSEQYPE